MYYKRKCLGKNHFFWTKIQFLTLPFLCVNLVVRRFQFVLFHTQSSILTLSKNLGNLIGLDYPRCSMKFTLGITHLQWYIFLNYFICNQVKIWNFKEAQKSGNPEKSGKTKSSFILNWYFVSPFKSNVPLLYPLKMSGNLWFSDGVKKQKIKLNWVNGKPSNAEAFN